jgi:hypothetical protein
VSIDKEIINGRGVWRDGGRGGRKRTKIRDEREQKDANT